MYGAPFVACTLLLTEANFVQQKSLLSDKSNFVYDKIIFVRQKLILSDKSWFCQTKVEFVRQKLILSDKSNLVLTKIASVNKSNFVVDKITFVLHLARPLAKCFIQNSVLVSCSDGRRRAWSNRRVAASPTLDRVAVSRSRYCSPIEMLWRLLHNIRFL